jgi:hypothetical protein
MNRRHVNEEAAWQSDVTGDAGALFAERFLGDLDDNVLTGFEHFGNELRTARRAGMAAMAMVMARATGSAGTSFEARTAGAATAISAAITSAITTAVGTSAAAIGTAATAAITVASTALRALEAGAWIAAADARGITRKVFARRGGPADARSARFAGEEDDVVFDDGGSACDGLACVGLD